MSLLCANNFFIDQHWHAPIAGYWTSSVRFALMTTSTDRHARRIGITQHTMKHASSSRPVCFAGCFGWLHLPPEERPTRTAVVLCPGLTADGLTGYRPLRLLAVALASAGYATLRLDYRGTGNSLDCDVDDLWQLWQDNIRDAIDWLRSEAVAERVVLCGLRAGAALAMEASRSHGEVAGVLMLEPVLRGRSYVRQLALEAGGGTADPADDGALAVQELALPAATVRRLGRLDLRHVRPVPSCPVAVFAQTPTKPITDCVAAWRGAGTQVDVCDMTGLEAILRPVLMNHTSVIDASAILDWLGRQVPAAPGAGSTPRLPEECVLWEESFSDTAIRFGPERCLFGILCEPATPSGSGIAVVITNSSANPSYGFGRFGVQLARRLADAGIASLRMDFSGIGDSIAPGDEPTHIFEADRRAELRAAIDLLAARGYRQYALQGLCSGAYHALHAGFDDPRVSTLLLVNLQHLTWNSQDRVELKGFALRPASHFVKKLGSPAVWIDILRGRFDVAGILAVQAQRLAGEFKRRADALLGSADRTPTTITDQMRTLALRARTLFLMSQGDDGLPVLTLAFGADLSPPGAIVRIVPDLDHALSTAAMRRTAIDHLLTFLDAGDPAEQAAPRMLVEATAA